MEKLFELEEPKTDLAQTLENIVNEKLPAFLQKTKELSISAVKQLSAYPREVNKLSDGELAKIEEIRWPLYMALYAEYQKAWGSIFEALAEKAGVTLQDVAEEERKFELDDVLDKMADQGVSLEAQRSVSNALNKASVGNLPADVAAFLNDCCDERNRREAAAKDAQVEFEGRTYPVMAKATVLWSGWESDNKAWVINKDGQPTLLTTNHGALEEAQASFLKEKIKEYQEAIEQSQALLNLLTSK